MTFISLHSSLSRKQKKELNSSIVTRYLLLLGGLYKHKISTFSLLTVMSEPANADASLSFRFLTSIGKEVMVFRTPIITPPCLLFRFSFLSLLYAFSFTFQSHELDKLRFFKECAHCFPRPTKAIFIPTSVLLNNESQITLRLD